MTEKIIAQRKFTARLPEGGRIVATGKLSQLQGNARPHFSLTGDMGCDHERILQAMPWLKPLVEIHLSDDRGWPMHALANAQYHVERKDVKALANHWRIPEAQAGDYIGDAYRLTALKTLDRGQLQRMRRAKQRELYLQQLQVEARLANRPRAYDQVSPDSGTIKDMIGHGSTNALRSGPEQITRRLGCSFIRAKRVHEECIKAAAAAPDLETMRRQCEKVTLYGIVEGLMEHHTERWQREADSALALLEPDDYRDPNLDDIGELWISIDGEKIEVSEVHTGAETGYLVHVDCGAESYYLAPSSKAAGLAAREYWQEMAKDDPEEFAAMVGAETLTKWALGQAAGPGTSKVCSLDEWLDLWLDTPAEQWASYDSQELGVTLSEALCERLGWVRKSPNRHTAAVAYRHN